jgi:hypothetical protein
MPAAERMTVEAPIVAITMLKMGADMIGRTTTRSSTTPMAPDKMMVMKKTDQYGSPYQINNV